MLAATQQTVTITVHSARALHDTNLFGKMDPYVKVNMGGQVFTTRVAENQGRTPFWDQTFVFSYFGETSIRFTVYDKDKMTADDYIGTADVSIAPIGATPNKRYAAEIELTRRKGSFAGYLKVTVVMSSEKGKVDTANASCPNVTTAYTHSTAPCGASGTPYGAPAPAYGAPAPAYGAQATPYGAPAPAYGAQATPYGAPAYGAQATPYGAQPYGAYGTGSGQYGAYQPHPAGVNSYGIDNQTLNLLGGFQVLDKLAKKKKKSAKKVRKSFGSSSSSSSD